VKIGTTNLLKSNFTDSDLLPVMVSPNIEPQPIVLPPDIVDTCKWTNCNENCPTGFKNVPRDGTKLMMTDDTACLSGTHQFCCPADEEQPTCLWRGFKNSGACSPGCKADEAEVGTLSVGCSSKHQSACCTALPVVEAYNDCKWVGSAGLCSKSGGHASCPSDYSEFIVAGSAGAGGEQVCSQGAKSYCCKNPAPSQWTDCAWNTKQSSLPSFFQGACDSSCPSGTIRIAMQKGGCSYGWESYCCKGQPPPTIAPRDPSFGNGQYAEFSALIDDYMKDSTCPATYLSEQGGDFYYDNPVKRSNISIRQGPPCSQSSFERLVYFIGTLISQYYLVGASLRALW
jgi:chitinase